MFEELKRRREKRQLLENYEEVFAQEIAALRKMGCKLSGASDFTTKQEDKNDTCAQNQG